MSTVDLVLSRPRLGRSRGLLAATFVVALLRVAPADAAESQDPLAVDEYARRYEVTPSEADARLELQTKAAGIANALSNRLGDDFAGVWFDNQDGQLVVPLVSDKDDAAVAKQFAEYGVDESGYRTTLVDSTIAELQASQRRLIEAGDKQLPEGGVRIGIDPSTNSVVVEISSDVGAENLAAARARAAAEPTRVKVVEKDPQAFVEDAQACTWNSERRACDPPFHGGVEIYGPTTCTSGFAATGNALGNSFVMTAGHCLSHPGAWWAQTSNGYQNELGTQEGYFYGGGNGDGGVIRVQNSNWWVKEWGWRGHVVIWGPPSNPAAVQNASNPIYGSASSYVGEYVCHSGRSSGSSCGTVTQLNFKTTYGDGTRVEHMTRVNGACAEPGDSGGPVYAGNTALGVWSGGQGACAENNYTEVHEIESIYGVHVTTW
jgi:streptogrisin C